MIRAALILSLIAAPAAADPMYGGVWDPSDAVIAAAHLNASLAAGGCQGPCAAAIPAIKAEHLAVWLADCNTNPYYTATDRVRCANFGQIFLGR